MISPFDFLSELSASAVQSPNLSSRQIHEEHEGKEMTHDGRAQTGRSAVFGRLSTIVKSFHAHTKIALAKFTTRKPEVLRKQSLSKIQLSRDAYGFVLSFSQAPCHFFRKRRRQTTV